MKGFFAETLYPWVQMKLDSIEGNNVEAVINEMDRHLRSNMYYYDALRQFHSKAGSTEAANKWAVDELGKILSSIENDMVSQFAAQGVKITKSISKIPASQLGLTSFKTGGPFLGRDIDTYVNKTYYQYSVDIQNANVRIDENGNVVKSSNGMLMGGLALAGLGFFWFKGMKKFK